VQRVAHHREQRRIVEGLEFVEHVFDSSRLVHDPPHCDPLLRPIWG
jgi:hypothetical protein